MRRISILPSFLVLKHFRKHFSCLQQLYTCIPLLSAEYRDCADVSTFEVSEMMVNLGETKLTKSEWNPEALPWCGAIRISAPETALRKLYWPKSFWIDSCSLSPQITTFLPSKERVVTELKLFKLLQEPRFARKIFMSKPSNSASRMFDKERFFSGR